jgi:hypothetical protein
MCADGRGFFLSEAGCLRGMLKGDWDFRSGLLIAGTAANTGQVCRMSDGRVQKNTSYVSVSLPPVSLPGRSVWRMLLTTENAVRIMALSHSSSGYCFAMHLPRKYHGFT